MSRTDEEQYCFLVEWFDAQASLVRKYQLFFFPEDNSLEMYDVKNRRTFLKRGPLPSITLKDLFVGASITVYARQLKVVAFGDEQTRRKLETQKSKMLAIIKPDAYENIGKILDTILSRNFTIGRMKMSHLTVDQAADFYGNAATSADALHLASGNILAVEVVGDLRDWSVLLGGVDDAKLNAPTLRGQFGTDSVKNAVHGSLTADTSARELAYIFDNPRLKATATSRNCTCCIIKPHAITTGLAGKIIDGILEDGFEISALQTFRLDKAAAEEFLEVYKTVVPEYNAMLEQLISGPLIAMEVTSDDGAVTSFRELCGPMDPEIARHIRPNTLRAKYGVDRVRNGVHCTDLPEDGALECEYFFSILQGH